jgi:hypothetical protein
MYLEAFCACTTSDQQGVSMYENRTRSRRTVSRQLEANSRAALAADQAYLGELTRGVRWERRGWLDRLVKVEEPPAQTAEHRTKGSSPDRERLVA